MGLKAITQALVARVAVPNGAGSYTYNLSGSGAVVVSMSDPEIRPGASVSFNGVSESEGPELGDYEREASWLIAGAAPSISDKPQEQVYAALNMLDDITRAIRLDRFLGGLVLWCRMDAAVITGNEGGVGNSIPMARVTYTARWLESQP